MTHRGVVIARVDSRQPCLRGEPVLARHTGDSAAPGRGTQTFRPETVQIEWRQA
jgi:hypothetical protein